MSKKREKNIRKIISLVTVSSTVNLIEHLKILKIFMRRDLTTLSSSKLLRNKMIESGKIHLLAV